MFHGNCWRLKANSPQECTQELSAYCGIIPPCCKVCPSPSFWTKDGAWCLQNCDARASFMGICAADRARDYGILARLAHSWGTLAICWWFAGTFPSATSGRRAGRKKSFHRWGYQGTTSPRRKCGPRAEELQDLCKWQKYWGSLEFRLLTLLFHLHSAFLQVRSPKPWCIHWYQIGCFLAWGRDRWSPYYAGTQAPGRLAQHRNMLFVTQTIFVSLSC